MTVHAKYALRGPSISQILDLPLAIPAFEAIGTKCLISRQDCQILDLITTITTTIGAVVADERAVAEKEEVCVGVKECAAGIAPEAVDVPSVSSLGTVSVDHRYGDTRSYLAQMPFLPRVSSMSRQQCV